MSTMTLSSTVQHCPANSYFADVSQRTQMFNKIHRQTTSLLDAVAAKYGFEAALVMCGNTINEDVSLAFIHTTGAANSFFKTRCCADKDAIIGHLKSHVYNNVSLEIVSDAFNDVQPKEVGGILGHSKEAGEILIVAWTETDEVANEKSDTVTSSDDMLNYIKDGILQLMEALQESKSPIIIGAPPQADSQDTNAQCVYYDGAVDFEGPAHLPPNNARTCIKPHKMYMSKGTTDNAITLSSEEDIGGVVKPAKKSKAKPATLKVTTLNKGKSKYVLVDSSDDEACTADAAPPTNDDVGMTLLTTNGLQIKDDYLAPGPEGKHKANAIVPSHVSKKPALQPRMPDAHIDDPFTDSWHSHIDIELPSPSLKQHILLTPILKTHGEEELTALSTASSNPPPFVLSPCAKEKSSTEQHPPVPPAVPLAPNPMHYQYPFVESNSGSK
ncbi:hypothetical protein HD554DRAFT_2169420 [Boletus coccyginus]|nr:hypothetical protein HD554DRAFT_2169420 [Boletus coccyginus]